MDRGADFGSVYFETLLSRYSILKKERPPEQPRFGSLVERLFGTTTTELLNQLRGNTQASKIPRQMTREVDPKQLAVWTLERFQLRFSQWVYEIYDQMEHPALVKALVKRSTRNGTCWAAHSSPDPVLRDFLMLTRPTTAHRDQAKFIPSRGLRSTGLHYWNEQYANRRQSGSQFRYATNLTIWALCMPLSGGSGSNASPTSIVHVHGRSEREWNLILDEWREQQRQHGQSGSRSMVRSWHIFGRDCKREEAAYATAARSRRASHPRGDPLEKAVNARACSQ